ncbi:hypothetical protein PENCOP_c001G05038 [Penicillium coprophilum]|uniref:Uncharacterized protein n=1 Tax=Penicillium coprophilum TaxID=36646 RepID=A0A1V6V9Y5_9EURO|nr:hypothetical protein PENCOP_c001G05038 [Penicillium coprophilum]
MPQQRRWAPLNPFARGYTQEIKEAMNRMPIPNESVFFICLGIDLLIVIGSNVVFASGVAQNPSTRAISSTTSARQYSNLATVAFVTNRLLNVVHAQMLKFVKNCAAIAATTVPSINSPEIKEILCQPCMNYQMSLNPIDQPLAITDKVAVGKNGNNEEEELNSESAAHSGSVALSGSAGCPESVDLFDSLGQPECLERGIEKALVLRDGSSDSDSNARRGGFAKVKAHRPRQQPVPDPEPAPGWAPGTRKANDGTPWKGGSIAVRGFLLFFPSRASKFPTNDIQAIIDNASIYGKCGCQAMPNIARSDLLFIVALPHLCSTPDLSFAFAYTRFDSCASFP